MSQIASQPPGGSAMLSLAKLYQKFADLVKILNVSDACVGKIVRWDLQKILEGFFTSVLAMNCGFKVLNHGDTWLNNILYKKDDEDNFVDVQFIDLQLSFWGTPNADLIYFLFSSVRDDVKVKHFDEITEFYYSELQDSLKKLDFDGYIPTTEELKEDLVKCRGFGKKINYFYMLNKYFIKCFHSKCNISSCNSNYEKHII